MSVHASIFGGTHMNEEKILKEEICRALMLEI